MRSLFENCTGVVLSSPYVLERASFHLPRGISYFLLYLALETRNHHAVRKLVEKWPHSDLSLNFLSSPLCRSHRSTIPHCLEPHEYGGVFGSYARYSCDQNVSSLLEGVFYNMYFYSRIAGGSTGLRGLDMSDVVVNVQQVPLLLNLVNGTDPVTSLRDYVTDKEAQTLKVFRSQLSSQQQYFPVILYINLMLDDTTSKQTVAMLAKISSQQQWVQVVVKRINMLGLTSNILKKLQPNLDALLSPITDHVYLTGTCLGELGNITAASPSFSLWVSCDTTLSPRLAAFSGNCESFLLATQERTHQLAVRLSELSVQSLALRAFCILRQRNETSEDLCKALGSFLLSVSASLEYIQLRRWSLLSTDLESLAQCSKLRVISITEDCEKASVSNSSIHSPSDIFLALSQLPHLEFFQWSESINLTTAALLSLHHLLCNSVRSLQHFHVCLKLMLLSTTDLETESYFLLSDVLLPLLKGKEGNESCTTYMFPFENTRVLGWLYMLRPEVCFRLSKEVECVIQLHEAATVYDHLY